MDELPTHPAAETHPDDRRKSVRYSITVAVRFQWRADDGRWRRLAMLIASTAVRRGFDALLHRNPHRC